MSALETTPLIPATRSFWTAQELAERWGVDVDTVYDMAATGGLPHQRFGRAYRFSIEKTLAFEEQRTIMQTQTTGPRRARAPRPNVRRSPRTSSRTGGFTPQPYAGPLRKR